MYRNIFASAIVLAGLAGPGACNRSAHERASAPEIEPLSLTTFTPTVELFMEYPPLVRGEAVKFVSHFTVLATGEPIRSGTLTFEATDEHGKDVTFRAEKPARDGLFLPIHTFDAPGKYKSRFLLDSPQARDSIDLGELIVYANQTDANAASPVAEPEPPGAVHFLMEQQWKIGMLLGVVEKRSLTERLICTGEIAAPVDASAAVSAPVAGRISAPTGGNMPRLGDSVSEGQILASIEPPLPAMTDIAAQALDLQSKGLEIERSLSDSEARFDFAQREVERLETVRKKGVGTEQQLDEAKRNLRIAEAERVAARSMRVKYDQASQQLGVLLDAAQAISGEGRPSKLLNVPLLAPIAGSIVKSDHVIGEHIDTHEEVFRIINFDRVWIVARVTEFDIERLPPSPNATITPHAYRNKSIDVQERGGRFIHADKVVEPQSRTVGIRYEIPNNDGALRVGMFVDVLLETRRTVDALTVPENAVVMDGGRPVAFVLLEGELFQKRELELGIRDSGYVEITKGIAAGERVVVRGAYAVKLSSMSGGFGPGHVH